MPLTFSFEIRSTLACDFLGVLARLEAGAERGRVEARVACASAVSCSAVFSGVSNSLACRSQNLP